jgi:hypothetical protein
MDNEVAKHLAAQQEKLAAFRKVLTAESDRGCALFAAAYLDASLSDLLYVSLVCDKSIENELFKGTAPLATFSSRITMAYYLGLISPACRRELDIIRAVRNGFAHNLDVISFTTPSVRDRCRSLAFSYHEKQNDPRDDFNASVLAMLAHIHAAILTTVPHTVRLEDTPSSEAKAEHRKLVEEIARLLSEPPDRDVAGD